MKKIGCSRVALMPALFICMGVIIPSSTIAQTVLGPEFTLIKSDAHSLQRDERKCDYFLWTKLGGQFQRIAFNYNDVNGKIAGDTPRVANVSVVIHAEKTTPTAQMIDTDSDGRTLWRLEMAQYIYDSNKACLPPISPSDGK